MTTFANRVDGHEVAAFDGAPGDEDDPFAANDDDDVADLDELETFGTTSKARAAGGLKVLLPQVG